MPSEFVSPVIIGGRGLKYKLDALGAVNRVSPVIIGGRGLKSACIYALNHSASQVSPVIIGGRGLKFDNTPDVSIKIKVSPVIIGGRGLKSACIPEQPTATPFRPSLLAGAD